MNFRTSLMLPEEFTTQLAKKAYDLPGKKSSLKFPVSLETFQPHLDKLVQDLPPQARILDIGCGNGTYLEYLHNQGFRRLLGIDVSSVMIEEAKKKVPTYMVLLKDFHNLSSLSDKYDAAYAIFSLLYTNKTAFKNILKDVHNLLNPSGRFFLTMVEGGKTGLEEEQFVSQESGTEQKQTVYLSYYSKDELIGCLADAGFNIESCVIYPELFPNFSTILAHCRKPS